MGDPVRVEAAEVTSTFFPLFNFQPAVGRAFSLPEDRPGAAPVAILTSGFAQSHFGSADNAISKSILLNDVMYNIVGVMPEDFRFPDNELKSGHLPVAVGP